MKKQNKFTMIEILLAMGIIIVGITGIMGLYPVGLNFARNSIANNYLSIEAKQIANYFNMTAKTNWSDISSLPVTKPADTDEHTKGTALQPTIFPGLSADSTAGNGVYWLKSSTSSSADFTAIVRCWRDSNANTEKTGYIGNAKNTIDLAGEAYKIYVEFSWPATIPYSGRQKKIIVLEVFKP